MTPFKRMPGATSASGGPVQALNARQRQSHYASCCDDDRDEWEASETHRADCDCTRSEEHGGNHHHVRVKQPRRCPVERSSGFTNIEILQQSTRLDNVLLPLRVREFAEHSSVGNHGLFAARPQSRRLTEIVQIYDPPRGQFLALSCVSHFVLPPSTSLNGMGFPTEGLVNPSREKFGISTVSATRAYRSPYRNLPPQCWGGRVPIQLQERRKHGHNPTLARRRDRLGTYAFLIRQFRERDCVFQIRHQRVAGRCASPARGSGPQTWGAGLSAQWKVAATASVPPRGASVGADGCAAACRSTHSEPPVGTRARPMQRLAIPSPSLGEADAIHFLNQNRAVLQPRLEAGAPLAADTSPGGEGHAPADLKGGAA